MTAAFSSTTWYCPISLPITLNDLSNQTFKLPLKRKWSPSTQESTPSTAAQFGLKILAEPSPSIDSSTRPMNIIFVHGLGGDSKVPGQIFKQGHSGCCGYPQLRD